jgi:hypothetical protein
VPSSLQIAIAYGHYQLLSLSQLAAFYYQRHSPGMNTLLTREALIADILTYDFGYDAVERWVRSRIWKRPSRQRAKRERLGIHLIKTKGAL